MNNLEIFENEEFGQVRTMLVDGDMWFVATDICNALGIKNTTQAMDKLDEDERSMSNIGRQGDANIINESGLYAVILRSDKPNAKKFRKWVTHDILPSIRKTGQYRQYNPTIDEEAKRILLCKNEMKNEWHKKMFPVMQSIADSMGISRKQLYSMVIDEVENYTNLKTRGIELQANYGFIPSYKMDTIEMYTDLQKSFEEAVFSLFTTHLNRSVRSSYDYNLIATDKTIMNACDKIEEA